MILDKLKMWIKIRFCILFLFDAITNATIQKELGLEMGTFYIRRRDYGLRN